MSAGTGWTQFETNHTNAAVSATEIFVFSLRGRARSSPSGKIKTDAAVGAGPSSGAKERVPGRPSPRCAETLHLDTPNPPQRAGAGAGEPAWGAGRARAEDGRSRRWPSNQRQSRVNDLAKVRAAVVPPPAGTGPADQLLPLKRGRRRLRGRQ